MRAWSRACARMQARWSPAMCRACITEGINTNTRHLYKTCACACEQRWCQEGSRAGAPRKLSSAGRSAFLAGPRLAWNTCQGTPGSEPCNCTSQVWLESTANQFSLQEHEVRSLPLPHFQPCILPSQSTLNACHSTWLWLLPVLKQALPIIATPCSRIHLLRWPLGS